MNERSRTVVRDRVSDIGYALFFAGGAGFLIGLCIRVFGASIGETVMLAGGATGMVGVFLIFFALVGLGPKELYAKPRVEEVAIGRFLVSSGSLTIAEPTLRGWRKQAIVVEAPPDDYAVTITLRRYSDTLSDITKVTVRNGEVEGQSPSQHLTPLFTLGDMVLVDSEIAEDAELLHTVVKAAKQNAEGSDGYAFIKDGHGRARGIFALVTGEEDYDVFVTSTPEGLCQLTCGEAVAEPGEQ